MLSFNYNVCIDRVWLEHENLLRYSTIVSVEILF